MELLTKETGLEKLTGQRMTTNELLSFIDKAFLDLEINFHPHNFPEEQGKFNKLMDLLISSINMAAKSGWDNLTIRKKLPTVWQICRSTEFGRHMQDWPRGYPGDYQTINMIVDWHYKDSGGFNEAPDRLPGNHEGV